MVVSLFTSTRNRVEVRVYKISNNNDGDSNLKKKTVGLILLEAAPYTPLGRALLELERTLVYPTTGKETNINPWR